MTPGRIRSAEEKPGQRAAGCGLSNVNDNGLVVLSYALWVNVPGLVADFTHNSLGRRPSRLWRTGTPKAERPWCGLRATPTGEAQLTTHNPQPITHNPLV